MDAKLLLRGAVSAAMLAVQAILLVALAPLLTLVVVAVLAGGAGIMLPLVGRAYGLGVHVMRGNLTLIDTTSQFLSGLKLAIGQNLQPAFLSEFRRTNHDQTTHQLDFLRRQARARAVAMILT